ncbi:MAG: DUF1592 domain-containing protein [Polyangiales bacterium]
MKSFISSFASRAFRRPVTENEVQRLGDLFQRAASQSDRTTAVAFVIEAVLQSPFFLYRVRLVPQSESTLENIPLDGYQLAARLSYLLTGSMPDDELFAAAADGTLSNDDELRMQTERLMQGKRFMGIVNRFVMEWFGLSDFGNTRKSKGSYAAFDSGLRSRMMDDLNRFVHHVFFVDDARLHTLLTSRVAFVNSALAAVLDVPEPSETPPVLVELDPKRRAGMLTRAAFYRNTDIRIKPIPLHVAFSYDGSCFAMRYRILLLTSFR